MKRIEWVFKKEASEDEIDSFLEDFERLVLNVVVEHD